MGIGVFDGVELLADCADMDAAEEYRRSALELDHPEGFRRSPYDDLQVAEIPEEYDLWWRVLDGLRRSRARDRVMEQLHQVAEEAGLGSLLRKAEHAAS